MRRRGLTPAGPMRVVWVVSCYMGTEFKPEDYVYRFAIPVGDG